MYVTGRFNDKGSEGGAQKHDSFYRIDGTPLNGSLRVEGKGTVRTAGCNAAAEQRFPLDDECCTQLQHSIRGHERLRGN